VKNLHRESLIWLAVALLACSGEGGTDPQPPDENPTPTPPGTPTGPAVTTIIGPGGGTLVSADGGLILTVPAGSVAQATEFGIQPITNQAHAGVGQAFRLTPEGQTFSPPVRLSFTYSEADLADTSPEGLGIAVQDAQGYWRGILNTEVDTANHLLTVSASHFSDHATVTFWRFMPTAARLKPGESTALIVQACVSERGEPFPGEEELAFLPRETCGSSIRAGTWLVNGVRGGNLVLGTVAAGSPSSEALYEAPGSVPGTNPVTVTALMTWTERGLTKRFDSRITIYDRSRYHFSASFSGVVAVGRAGIIADVTDRVEADFEVPEPEGGLVTVSGVVNQASVAGNPRLPPEIASLYCNWSLDGPYEHVTASGGSVVAGGELEGRAETSVSITGITSVPPSSASTPTDQGCERAPYDGATFPYQIDARFDRLVLTVPGDQHTYTDLAGWTYTFELKE
jgi:hypothetical protein